MVQAEDVIHIYQSLAANNIQVWLTGGWGIDALLGKQTRPHKDVDVIMLLDDIVRMREIMAGDGYCLKELWPENNWVVDVHGTEIPTAFVLRDSNSRELDVAAMRFDDRGNGIPVWADDVGFVFKREDLAGEGMIAGFPVRCFSPEMQVYCHTGYDLPLAQVRDLELLRDKFGIE